MHNLLQTPQTLAKKHGRTRRGLGGCTTQCLVRQILLKKSGNLLGLLASIYVACHTINV
jgi:hypothetical protein